MKGQFTGPVLSTVFVDYDNIYLSLRRKNEEAAKRFAKDAALWLREIESGRLLTPTNAASLADKRRIVLTRCYGNPVPRRNSNDNSTDMSSFPFVRHHFQRAGFETIDCPPLTSQLKNSADIRMVMDIRDLLNHDTYFDEFIILSGDADFTPVLHRLRAHARRTVVFANDHTAAPYTAISDGELREASLISLLLEGRLTAEGEATRKAVEQGPSSAALEAMRKEILAEVVGSVRSAIQPVPLEALADRAVRALGHDKTVGSQWGGTGGFRDLLVKGLPSDIRLSEQPPYYVYDASRQIAAEPAAPAAELREPRRTEARETRYDARTEMLEPQAAQPRPQPPARALPPAGGRAAPLPPSAGAVEAAPSLGHMPVSRSAPEPETAPPSRGYNSARPAQSAAYEAPPAPAPQRQQAPPPSATATAIQQSIARIHEACQAPPLSPPEYRVLFEVMADEISTNNLAGSQTLANIAGRAREMGLELRREDVRFVLEVVSEADPWFEHGASASLFASRFRNFVVARCRAEGLNLSANEIDLIDAWFGGAAPQRTAAGYADAPLAEPAATRQAPSAHAASTADRWSGIDDGHQYAADTRGGAQPALHPDDEFPRIVRTRLRG